MATSLVMVACVLSLAAVVTTTLLSYKTATLYNGRNACATDGPSRQLLLVNTRMKNKPAKCGCECTSQLTCLLYQYKDHTQLCEVFDYWPKTFNHQPQCTSFRLAGKTL